jgi:hypothetical protein
MKTSDEGSELYAVIRNVCDSHKDQPSLNPVWLATEAMAVIGFTRELHELGWIGCHLQFRQIARTFCRKHFDPAEAAASDLFQETLQERYPRRDISKAANIEPEYVLLDLLEAEDIHYNIARLRAEAAAKLKHADALEAWGRRRFGRSWAA